MQQVEACGGLWKLYVEVRYQERLQRQMLWLFFKLFLLHWLLRNHNENCVVRFVTHNSRTGWGFSASFSLGQSFVTVYRGHNTDLSIIVKSLSELSPTYAADLQKCVAFTAGEEPEKPGQCHSVLLNSSIVLYSCPSLWSVKIQLWVKRAHRAAHHIITDWLRGNCFKIDPVKSTSAVCNPAKSPCCHREEEMLELSSLRMGCCVPWSLFRSSWETLNGSPWGHL